MAPSSEETNHTPHRVLTLYKFVSPSLPENSLKDLQAEIETECRKYRGRGTFLLAQEGINGTICYPFSPKQEKDPLLDYLQSKFDNSLRIRLSSTDRAIFARLKIKIKSEIVTMHQEGCHPAEAAGTYVKPDKWNDLLQDPDCLVVDTRNDYEVQIGTFRDAVNPHTRNFTEFPDWMQKNLVGEKGPKKIAMFCKSSLEKVPFWLLHHYRRTTGSIIQLFQLILTVFPPIPLLLLC
jgi:UPF0176 protein